MAGQIYSKYDMDILGAEQSTSEGIVSGFTIRCGREDVGDSETILADCGSLSFDLPSVAQQISVVSDNIGDTSVISIDGLDGDGVEMSELVVLNGTTPVLTTSLFYRIFRCTVASGDINIGDITFTFDSVNSFCIAPGIGITRLPTYTVPKGFRAFVKKISGSVGKGKDTTINFKFSTVGVNGFVTPFSLELFESAISDEFKPNISFGEGTDFLVTAKSSQGDTTVFAGIDFLLILLEIGEDLLKFLVTAKAPMLAHIIETMIKSGKYCSIISNWCIFYLIFALFPSPLEPLSLHTSFFCLYTL